MEQHSGSVEIAAPPEKIWEMVSDLPRMGEWSPMNVGGKWLGGATSATVGAKFKGKNKNGRHVWSGPVTITEAQPPSRLSFTVGIGPVKGATWSYDIAPTATGCTVTETWTDTRSAMLRMGAVTKLVTGNADLGAYAQTSIDTTLANLKKAAEG